MTTFMAKLIYKLTEMSCAHANQYVVAHNQIKEMEEREKGRMHGDPDGFKMVSKLRDEFKFKKLGEFELSKKDMLNFESNTQLLTDEMMNIPTLVQQCKQLAKKHVDSINLIAE